MLPTRGAFFFVAVIASAVTGSDVLSADVLRASKPQGETSLKRGWSISAAADADLPLLSGTFDHSKESFIAARLTSDPLAEMRRASAAFLENVVGEDVPALMTRAMEAFKAPLNIFLARQPLTLRVAQTAGNETPAAEVEPQPETTLAEMGSDASSEDALDVVDSESPVTYFRPTTFLDDKKTPSQILSELPRYEGSGFDDFFYAGDEEQHPQPVKQQVIYEPITSWNAAIQTLLNRHILTPDEVDLLESSSPPEMMADSRKLNEVVDRLLSIARRIGHGSGPVPDITPPVEKIFIQAPPEVVVMTPPTEPVLPFLPIEPPLPVVYSRPYDPYSLSLSPREVPRGVPIQNYPRDYLTFQDPAMDSYLHRAYLPTYTPAQLLLDPFARGRYIYAMDEGRGMDTEPMEEVTAPNAAPPPDRPFSRELPFTVKSLKMNLNDYLSQATK